MLNSVRNSCSEASNEIFACFQGYLEWFLVLVHTILLEGDMLNTHTFFFIPTINIVQYTHYNTELDCNLVAG